MKLDKLPEAAEKEILRAVERIQEEGGYGEFVVVVAKGQIKYVRRPVVSVPVVGCKEQDG